MKVGNSIIHKWVNFCLLYFSCVTDNIVIIAKALKNQFVIPEFSIFMGYIDRIFEKVSHNKSGKVMLYSLTFRLL